jgi:hypothetical protein
MGSLPDGATTGLLGRKGVTADEAYVATPDVTGCETTEIIGFIP